MATATVDRALDPNGETRNQTRDLNWLPRFGRIFKSQLDPVSVPPKPQAERPWERDLPTAGKVYARLSEVGDILTAQKQADPDALRTFHRFGSTEEAKAIGKARAADIDLCLREAAAEKPLSAHNWDLGRAAAAILDGHAGSDQYGAITVAKRSLDNLRDSDANTRFARDYAPKLEKLRREFVEAAVIRAGAKYRAYEELAAEARSKCVGVAVSQFPEVTRIGDLLNAVMRQTRGAKSADDVLKA